MRHSTQVFWIPAALVSLIFACGSDDAASGGSDASTGSDGGSTSADGSTSGDGGGQVVLPASCNGSKLSTADTATGLPDVPSSLSVIAGFKMEVAASIDGARELAALPNGDLVVGTNGSAIYIIPNAEADGTPGKSAKFANAPDSNPSGVTYVPTTCTLYLGTNQGVYKATYKDADLTGDFGAAIAKVRQGTPTPGSDGDVHQTTSVAFSNGTLYASVGSGCNACTEVDPTRATIQQMNADGSNMTLKAAQIRNAIAITTNPDTGTVWAGGAGQDSLPNGHPYEFFDAVTSHSGEANYGWPDCEEDHHQYGGSSDCSQAVQPLIEFTAYSTLIGAAFYSKNQGGSHVFPAAYKGGVFITNHGSWHSGSVNGYFSPPRLAFVAMNGDTPVTPVDWSDPTKQWTEIVLGWSQNTARATGVAVGSKGSLFVADDHNGLVYRIRPN